MVTRTRGLVGCVLDGRYELLELVGEGSYGRVYRGRDQRLDRTVAVKLIKPFWCDDPRGVRVLEREVRLLARVSDPGIMQIFDVGHAPEGLYYVAEFIEGSNLADLLRRGPLSPLRACEIAEQLCRALAHAHARRVMHRDIKPGNVLLARGGRVTLGDFGVARLADAATDAGTGTVHGTPRYMAPEQARGAPPAPAADIYSVGVVLYEMLAGSPPFAGSSPVQLALSHAGARPPKLPAQVPPQLAAIVTRALAKAPAARYGGAAEMAQALNQARVALTQEGEVPAPADPVRPRRPQAGDPSPTRVAPRMHPRRNVNPAARRRSLLAFAFVAAVLGGMIAGAVILAAPGHVRVPALHGLTRSLVARRLRPLALRATFTSRYAWAPAGTAIGQSPATDTSVARGSFVQVVLSSGPPPVEVPRLAGQQAVSARSILASLGLRPAVVSVPAPGTAPGMVVAQSPPPGRYVPRGGRVSLSAAEVPRWRALGSYSGTGDIPAAPVTIRGTQFRIVYRMGYVGSCTWIVFCSGPSAGVIRNGGGEVSSFDLSDGGTRTALVRSGPGRYVLHLSSGSDTARWWLQVQDYY